MERVYCYGRDNLGQRTYTLWERDDGGRCPVFKDMKGLISRGI